MADPVNPDDGVHAKGCRRAGRGLHLLGGPLANALGITITPDAWIDHVLIAVVDDRLTHCLAVEMIGDRPATESVLFQDVSAPLQVAVVLDGFDDVEMITPAGNLKPVVAPAPGKPAYLLEGEIGPLSGEQRDRSRLS